MTQRTLDPDLIPQELWVIVNGNGAIVAEIGTGRPFTQREAEEEAAYLDRSLPDYIGPHKVVRYKAHSLVPLAGHGA